MTDLCVREHYELTPATDDGTSIHDVDDVTWWDVRPAPATQGALCGRCFGRINYLLDQVPQLVAHIKSQVAPSMQAATYGDRIGGTRDLPLPLRAAAMEDADHLYRVIADWMVYFATVHNIRPPGSLIESSVKGIDVKHLPMWTDQHAAFWFASDAVDWFKRNRGLFSQHTLMRPLFDVLEEHVRPLLRRYPQVERERQRTAQLCPDCGYIAITTRWAGKRPVVECEECGFKVPDDQVERIVDWRQWW